ncbi:MAG: DUF2958 domain-containing protein [Planctomycetota bacterium]|nr:DUF2958 domain-containing protein [Planctomycetota bacterium]
MEWDGPQRLAFGFVDGHEQEFGYFDLAELEKIRGPLGLHVERDLYFQPKPVSQCR